MSSSVNIHPQRGTSSVKPNGVIKTTIQSYQRADGTVWYSVDFYMADEDDNGKGTVVTFFPDMDAYHLDEAFPEALWSNPITT